MKTNRPFYKRASFYVAAAGLLLALIAVILYACNCGSEFNGNKPSSAVIGCDIAAIIMLAVALAGNVAESFFGEDTLVYKIVTYLRHFKYVAFVVLIAAFFMQILDEYSLLGTILYPLVSGTVGDPVDSALSASYFTSLIFTFVSVALAIVSALINKSEAAKATVIAEEKKADEQVTAQEAE